MTDTVRKFNITINSNSKQTKGWERFQPMTLDEFESMLTLPPARRDNKDGICMLPGINLGAKRDKNSIKVIDVLIYDCDGAQSFEEIDALLDKSGVYAILYSTYSHLSTKTKIKTDSYEQWAKRESKAFPPTTGSMIEYLKDNKKSYLLDKNLDFDIKQDPNRYVQHGEEGLSYILYHDPLTKLRVVLPLAEPIILADLAPTTKKFLDVYKSIYKGVGSALGLDYDESCSDPSRLYFLPSIPKDFDDKNVILVGYGMEDRKLLSFNDYPRAPMADPNLRRDKDGNMSRRSATDLIIPDRDGKPINLLQWNQNNENFDIEEALLKNLPDDMVGKSRDRGGYVITCPFEGEHTHAGGEGTFCDNGNGDDHPWMIHCSHNSCISAGRKRLEFLAEYIRLGYISAEDLGILQEEDTPEMSDENLAALGIEVKFDSIHKKKEQEDDEFVLKDYEAQPIPGDDVMSEDAVYDECLIALKTAKDRAEVARIYNRMRAKGCTIVLEDIAEVVAASPLKGFLVKTILRGLAKARGEDPNILIDILQKQREAKTPLAEKFAELSADSTAGAELDRELMEIAGWYGYDKPYVKKKFSEYCNMEVQQTRGTTMAKFFPWMLETYAKVRQGSSVVFLDKPRSKATGDAIVMNSTALATWLRNRNDIIFENGGKKPKRVYLYDAWMEDCKEIEEYNGVTFLPNGGDITSDRMYNIWDGWRLKEQAGTPTLVLNHIKEVWCNNDEKVYNWVITWFAHLFQKPEIKPHTAIALHGGQGTGKSTIFEHGFATILDNYYGVTADRESIVGRFSGHLVGKLMWLSEETLFSGDRRSMNTLKDRISRNTVDIEKKGVDKFTIPSYTRFIFTSNQPHAMHLEMDDRRFCVLDTRDTYVDNLVYFNALKTYLQEGGAAELLYYLLRWDPTKVGLSWESLFRAPMTQAKQYQIEQSVDTPDMFFMELLKYGRIKEVSLPQHKISWPLDAPGDNKYALTVRPEDFRAVYNEYLKVVSASEAKFNRNKFNKLFEHYFGMSLKDAVKTVRVNHEPKRMLCLPPRHEILERALKKKFVDDDQLDDILDDKSSHVYPLDDSDVI